MSVGAGTLADLPLGIRAVLDQPRLPTARARQLAELGLRAGCEVRALVRTPGGGRVVAIGDIRLALDRSVLAALPVRPPTTAGPAT
ncbi:MAG TPA: FeoA family protein [Marmoricola sp.]|jgi:ferrous iron transport protein A|nr:FeoA family protein [Marmoricola sp.]